MAGSSAQIIEIAKLSGIPAHPGSTYRPGAVTASGRQSWHATDNAVDFTGESQDALAAFFMTIPTLEVIHHSNRTGRNYASSNGKTYDLTRHPALLDQHRDHLHVAMSAAQVGPGSVLDKLRQVGSALVGAIPFIPNPQTVTDALSNLTRPLSELGEGAMSVGKVAQAVTRLFLPSNMIRAFALFFGTILILIGIWFLAREVRESQA